MSPYTGYKDRRSTSATMPRIFLILQFSILFLSSYISYRVLNSIGMSESLIFGILLFANLYFFSKLFFKCRLIIKRNQFGRGFNS